MPNISLLEGVWRIVPDAIVQAIAPLREMRHNVVRQRLELSSEAAQSGDMGEAIEHIRRALEVEPHDVGALNTLGSLYFQDGKFEKAADVFGKALDVDYFNADALKGHAYSQDVLGHTDDAIYDYLRFQSLRTDDSEVQANFVAALANCGKTAEAIAAGEQAQAQFPKDATFPALLARAYYDEGRFADAQREIEIACQLDFGRAESFRLAGLIYFGIGKLEQAAAAFDQAVLLDPANAENYLERARVMRELGRYDAYRDNAVAAKTLFEAAHDSAGVHEAWWELGWANYKLGRWTESAEASAKAVELDPKAAAPRYNLGLALLRHGEVQRAIEEYRAATALGDHAALTRDGISDLADAIEETPDLPGAAAILEELRAHQAATVPKRRRKKNPSDAV